LQKLHSWRSQEEASGGQGQTEKSEEDCKLTLGNLKGGRAPTKDQEDPERREESIKSLIA